MIDRTAHVWPKKFAAAWSGLVVGIKTQNSFWIHLPVAISVVIIAAWLRLEAWRWTTLILCIGIVIAGELFNSSIEQLVRVLHPDHDERVGRSLDMAAAGVLVLSIAAVMIGLIVIGRPLWERLLN